MNASHPVAVLPPEVSRRIAAGEVIERPASVVRELLDNSLDAGSRAIDLLWTAGGREEIRIADDGRGMSRADLELCWLPHATSKIKTIEDLERTDSLGFRGEALSSVAAVSELEIATSIEGAETGHRLRVREAELVSLDAAPPGRGTTVVVRRLFANLPARRRFLARSQAETHAIRNVIMDKALPFPDVRFTHRSDAASVRVLPPQSLIERCAEVFGAAAPPQSLKRIEGGGDGFTVTLIAAEPAIVRRDRRLIQVFVNRRRVWEYKLIQAVEYAYRDVQHGGLFPVAAVLVDIDPALVDFNIHPAKREARLRVGGEIHHRIVGLLRSFLRAYAVRAVQLGPDLPSLYGDRDREAARAPEGVAERPSPSTAGRAETVPQRPAHGSVRHSVAARAIHGKTPTTGTRAPAFDSATRAVPDDEDLVYRGTLFGTFIIVERRDRAWIIDQHAAHERILYDRFAADRTSQPLLVPAEFETSEDQDRLLSRHADEYREIGMVLERVADSRWRLSAAPTEYRANVEDLIDTILELGGLNEALDRTFIAEMACKAALKAGDYLDDMTAVELARRTLALPEPRCPHGRPLWIELTRADLEKLIGRR